MSDPSRLRIYDSGDGRLRVPRPAVWDARAGDSPIEVSVWLACECPHPEALPDPSGRTGLWLRVRDLRREGLRERNRWPVRG